MTDIDPKLYEEKIKKILAEIETVDPTSADFPRNWLCDRDTLRMWGMTDAQIDEMRPDLRGKS